jgi:hypothetical protein
MTSVVPSYLGLTAFRDIYPWTGDYSKQTLGPFSQEFSTDYLEFMLDFLEDDIEDASIEVHELGLEIYEMEQLVNVVSAINVNNVMTYTKASRVIQLGYLDIAKEQYARKIQDLEYMRANFEFARRAVVSRFFDTRSGW